MTSLKNLQFQGHGDAYLEWAHASGFARFQNATGQVGVIAQFESALTSEQVATLENTVKVHIPACYVGLTIASFSLARQALPRVVADLINTYGLQRIELATPVVSASNANKGLESLQGYSFSGKTLLGVIDHGCPFASSSFDDPKGVTRVWRLWDQNHNEQGEALDTSRRQPPLTDFYYGAQFTSTALNNFKAAREDEEVYRAIGMPYLRHAATHGAHVMDLFAGPVRATYRVSPNRNKLQGQEGHADAPPTWTPSTDEVAVKSPLVFVQLPTAAVDDPTGRWLGRNVLDGLHYIVQCAGSNTQRIVVNLSWGPQTGPHDGSALLELAMDELVRKQPDKRELAIVLPAGNSYGARAHAQFPAASGHENLTWIVPPGNESPSFLEVWWPKQTDPTAIGMRVTAPDGSVVDIGPNASAGIFTPVSSNAVWGVTVVPHETRCMALLALAPTFDRTGGVTACPGKWSVTIAKIADMQGDVDVYVARSNPNMGSRFVGVPSYLLDEHYLDKALPRPKDPGDKSACVVKREGTLNGIATGAATLVTGGYVRSSGLAAPYTSMGASAGRKPDYSLPSDESPALPGVLGGGVRNGSVFRLIGTSTAAPQLARLVAVAYPPPKPTGKRDARLGETQLPG